MDRYNDALPEHLMERITHHGFENEIDAWYNCENCGLIAPYHVKLSGRYIRGSCPCKVEALRRKEQAEMRMAWMRDQVKHNFEWLGPQWSDMPLKDKTFDNFDVSLQASAFDQVQYFLADMTGSLILFSEGYGTGKTHLLAAIVNVLRVNGIASRFVTAPDLFAAISYHISRNDDYAHLLHKATMTPLLVIDDVDKTPPTEFRERTYFDIIDKRTKRGLPIAISTNRISELARYVGGAACSRLRIGQLEVDMNGVDYRTRL